MLLAHSVTTVTYVLTAGNREDIAAIVMKESPVLTRLHLNHTSYITAREDVKQKNVHLINLSLAEFLVMYIISK